MRLGYCLVLIACLHAAPALAADVSAGRLLAKKWCAACHVVDGDQRKATTDMAPSFPSIARRLSTTRASLAAFLSTPHSKMPDYSLNRKEIRDISDYILSLREPPASTRRRNN